MARIPGTFPDGAGVSGAFGLSREDVDQMNRVNKAYFEGLLNIYREKHPDENLNNKFTVIENYSAWKYVSARTVTVVYPLYEQLISLEDKVQEIRGRTLPEIQNQLGYKPTLTPEAVKKLEERLERILDGKVVIKNFEISREDYNKIVGLWELTSKRYFPQQTIA